MVRLVGTRHVSQLPGAGHGFSAATNSPHGTRRIVFVRKIPGAPNAAPPLATEWTVEGRADGLAHAWFAWCQSTLRRNPMDGDDQRTVSNPAGRRFFKKYAADLGELPGQPSSQIQLIAMPLGRGSMVEENSQVN